MEKQEEKYGIDQLIKVLDVVIEIGNVAPAVQKAENTLSKIGALLPITDEVAGLATLKPSLLKLQWNDFSDVEKAQVMEHAKNKYSIEDKVLEQQIETGLELVRRSVDLVTECVDFVKTIKKS